MLYKDWGLADTAIEQLEAYIQSMLAYNEHTNLTRITNPKEIWIKHIYDSLWPFWQKPLGAHQSLIDIGTGAGFPGIVLKIIFPSLRLTLVESVGKKVKFLHEVVQSLGLNEVDIIQGRAEDLGQQTKYREQFDLATARAVAKLPVLCEYMIPFLRMGGHAYAYKATLDLGEREAGKKAARVLGGQEEILLYDKLPEDFGERQVVLYIKTKHTPAQYPRRVGVPEKLILGS